MVEEAPIKQAFFIKCLPSKDCCLLVLSYGFYKEDVQSLMKLLSRQAQIYLE